MILTLNIDQKELEVVIVKLVAGYMLMLIIENIKATISKKQRRETVV